MASEYYKIKATTLTGLADAIREKTGETGEIQVSEMAAKIASITGGGDSNVLEVRGVDF